MEARTPLSLLAAPAPQEALQQAIDSCLRRGRTRSLSPSTLRFYRDRLSAFARFLETRGLGLAPGQVTAPVVRDCLTAESRRVTAATANHSRVALSAFFRFLLNEELVPANPMARVEKVRLPRRVIPTLSSDEVEAMLATCSLRTFNGARLKAILLTLVDCGLRVSELCGLDLGDLDWDEQTLRVMGKGGRERRVPFGEAVHHSLRAYLVRRGGLPGQDQLLAACYADMLNRVEAHRLISKRGKRANISGVRCSPHTFRQECLNEHWFLSVADAQEKVEAWRKHYNAEWPHSALGNLVPEDFARASAATTAVLTSDIELVYLTSWKTLIPGGTETGSTPWRPSCRRSVG